MAWFEFHQGLYQHPKTLRLARALGVERVAAVGILAGLWDWALDFAQDGDMEDRFDEWCDFLRSPSLDPEKMADALEQTGWLDRDEHGRRVIHDWAEYGMKNLEKRKKAVKRTQKHRVERSPLRITYAQQSHNVREGYAHVMPLHESKGHVRKGQTGEDTTLSSGRAPQAHTRAHEGFDPWLDALDDASPAPIASVAQVATVAAQQPSAAPEAPSRGTRTKRGAVKVPEALRVIWGELPAKAKRDPDKTATEWVRALTNPHPLAPKVSEAELVAAVRAWARSEHVAAGYVVPLHAWLKACRWQEDWTAPRSQALATRPGTSAEYGTAVTGTALDRVNAAKARIAARAATEVVIHATDP